MTIQCSTIVQGNFCKWEPEALYVHDLRLVNRQTMAAISQHSLAIQHLNLYVT